MAQTLDARRTRLATLALALLLALAACERGLAPPDDTSAAPTFTAAASTASDRSIPGRFIVTLEPRANPGEVARAHGITPSHTYSLAMNGFAGSVSEAARAGLLRDARIVRVDPDRVVAEADGGTTAALP